MWGDLSQRPPSAYLNCWGAISFPLQGTQVEWRPQAKKIFEHVLGKIEGGISWTFEYTNSNEFIQLNLWSHSDPCLVWEQRGGKLDEGTHERSRLCVHRQQTWFRNDYFYGWKVHAKNIWMTTNHAVLAFRQLMIDSTGSKNIECSAGSSEITLVFVEVREPFCDISIIRGRIWLQRGRETTCTISRDLWGQYP